MFVESEYYFRHALGWGKGLARSCRSIFIGGDVTLYLVLRPLSIICRVIGYSLDFTVRIGGKKEDKKPFPYDHFISLNKIG